MRKLRTALCLLLLVLLAALLPQARRILPQDNRALVGKKYAGWSGVLRLWVCEGWQPGAGSFTAWLNACAAGFEKRHPGVYIQPQPVDAGAVASLNDSGLLPPDMLLFPPGLLDDPTGLLPLTVEAPLRPSLARCGAWRGAIYAVPVALGGYFWITNAAQIDGIPATWRGSGAVPAVPPDDDRHAFGAALLSLCACPGRSDGSSSAEIQYAPGIDLGLPDDAAATAPPADDPPAEAAPCALPEDFAFDGEAWRHFANGEAPALLATPREVRRLQALSEQGKAPDWRLSAAAPFTDQLLCLAVVDRPQAEAQQVLCAAFLEYLLGDDCQGALAKAGAFTATGVPAGYAAGDPLSEADAALGAVAPSAPPCFGTSWKSAAEAIVRKLIDGDGDIPALWRALNASFFQNPNILTDTD